MFTCRIAQRPLYAPLAALFAIVASAFFAEDAFAGTATTNFTVSATVVASCSVSASSLAFGSYTPSSGTPNAASTTINVTCTNGTTYGIALDGGSVSGSVIGRNLSDGASHLLSYGLYTAVTYTGIWGDGTNATSTVAGIGNGAAQGLTVYGRIPAGQYVKPASYTDQIGVTVSY